MDGGDQTVPLGRTLITQMDKGLFEQIFTDFESVGVGGLRAGLMSLDQREGPTNEI